MTIEQLEKWLYTMIIELESKIEDDGDYRFLKAKIEAYDDVLNKIHVEFFRRLSIPMEKVS